MDDAPADDEWWGELDDAVIACLQAHGAMAPEDLGRRLGLSEPAAASLLCMLALEGKVRICLVEQRAAARPADARAA